MKCINKLRERTVKKQAMGQSNTGNELLAVVKKQAMNQLTTLEKMLAVA